MQTAKPCRLRLCFIFYLSMCNGGKLIKRLHASEDQLLFRLSLEELQDGHGQLSADVVKHLRV